MKVVGIIGGGQLAQLLAMSAYQLGIKTLCFVDDENCPAKRFSDILIANLSDENALKEFAKQVDVITVENENIDITFLKKLEQFKPIFPSPNIIAIAQDRLLEKNYFKKLNIPTVNFILAQSKNDLENKNGILKTRTLGYDGKGQMRITEQSDINAIWHDFQKDSIFEYFCDFEYEVSQIIARDQNGEVQFFPLIQNKHEAGILRQSFFSDLDYLEESARMYTKKLADALNYVGVLCVEFFVKDRVLIANEMAPRVHNSGHLTIEGCNVSQFEQHLRAILNLKCFAPKIIQPVEMVNIIGTWPIDLSRFQHIYNYGKQSRENRKLGHGIIIKK